MLTLLHLADVHFDALYAGRTPGLRRQLREAQHTAFERAIDRACTTSVDAVLIAGDLLDAARLSLPTEERLLSHLRRLETHDIPVVYATGTHDPGHAHGRIAALDWPANVHVVRTADPQTIPLHNDSGQRIGQVVAVGHPRKQVSENLAIRFPEADPNVPTIGLMHAHIDTADGADAHDRYAPCSVSDLQRLDYTYWALGHIHRGQQVEADVPAYYAGNLQGRHPEETGVKGGLLVRIPPEGPADVTVQPLAPIRWETVHLSELETVHSVDAFIDTVRAALRPIQTQAVASEWMIRLVLHGQCPLAPMLHRRSDRREIAARLKARLNVLDVDVHLDDLTRPVEVDRHRGEPHLAGEVLALIDRAHDDPDTLDALAADIDWAQALHAAPTERRAYLGRLLNAMDRRAIARLIPDAADTP